MPNEFDHDVLIVGAGPVGLALAVELGHRGINTLVVEQNDRTGQQPRAKTTNVRTMEHMRRWGIAEQVRAVAPLPADYPTDIRFKTRLFGEPIARIENAFFAQRGTPNPLFSEPAQWIPQYKIEAVLHAHARCLPSVTLRFGCRLDALDETPTGVTATFGDRKLQVRYVAGADGARSRVRNQIGAQMVGQHSMAQHVGLVIRAPALRDIMRDEPAIMYWLVNADTPAVTSPMDDDDLWAFNYAMPADAVIDEATSRRCIDRAFGRPIDAEILTTDPWAAHSLLADRYATDRIFLIGDACHLHPPFGGYGMNLGIADAVDLGWKLAATLQGWGGPHLLASYEKERRPVHRRVIEEAVANHAVLPQHLVTADLESPGAAGTAARAYLADRIVAQKIREFRTLGVVLGTHYSGSPIVVPDNTPAPADHITTYEPSAHPGCLAPHAWLAKNLSLYDQFGPDLTLLATDPEVDTTGFASAAAARRIDLRIIHAPLATLYAARLALIRPDQHIAWRGDPPTNPGAILDIARGA